MNTIMKKIITKQSCNHDLVKINNQNVFNLNKKCFKHFIYIIKKSKFNIKCFKQKYEMALRRILGTKTYCSRYQFHCQN